MPLLMNRQLAENDAVGKGTFLFGGTYLPLNRDLLEDYITSSVLGGPLVQGTQLIYPRKLTWNPTWRFRKWLVPFQIYSFKLYILEIIVLNESNHQINCSFSDHL